MDPENQSKNTDPERLLRELERDFAIRHAKISGPARGRIFASAVLILMVIAAVAALYYLADALERAARPAPPEAPQSQR